MAKRDSLRRRRPFRRPLPRILIVCEGEVTEPSYFEGIRINERLPIELRVEPAGDPKAVVEHALQLRREADRESKKRQDVNLRYNATWCVFDVDDHERLQEAL